MEALSADLDREGLRVGHPRPPGYGVWVRQLNEEEGMLTVLSVNTYLKPLSITGIWTGGM